MDAFCCIITHAEAKHLQSFLLSILQKVFWMLGQAASLESFPLRLGDRSTADVRNYQSLTKRT